MTASEPVAPLTVDEVLPDAVRRGAGDVDLAVVGQLNTPGQTRSTVRGTRDLTLAALEALAELGARIRFYDVADDAEPDYAAIRAADGIVVLGGGDVEASRYGHVGEVPNEYGVDPRSDERQLRVFDDAFDDDAALLAICRGSQLLNVSRGGTLIPDLNPHGLHRGGKGEPLFKDEEVALVEGTIVRRIHGDRDRLVVRNGHHQAVGEVAPGLRATALAADGVVEGTEAVDRTWIIGVQWHPEEAAADPDDRRAIFAAIVDEARRRRDARSASA